MATVWLTYAWDKDNDDDVVFAAQELERAGLTVKMDRWTVQAGKRLWDQIEKHITNESECDAWVWFATQKSLTSEACKEEFAYALDRALKARGQFPVVGLFQGHVEQTLIPSGVKTRLYVSLTDENWVERVKAAAEGRIAELNRPEIPPYELKVHQKWGKHVIELRPRAGQWGICLVAVPLPEKQAMEPSLLFGPRGNPPDVSQLMGGQEASPDKLWWVMSCQNGVNPSHSCYLVCKKLPSQVVFGPHDGTQFSVNLNA